MNDVIGQRISLLAFQAIRRRGRRTIQGCEQNSR